jgi:hypothetical protein
LDLFERESGAHHQQFITQNRRSTGLLKIRAKPR